MCLEKVSNNEHIPEASGVGWKVFDLDSQERLVSWYISGEQQARNPYEINKWYEAYSFTFKDKEEYWRGFHIFTTRRDAKKWYSAISRQSMIYKVRWRHRLATGTQYFCGHNYSCVVAKEILILPKGYAPCRS